MRNSERKRFAAGGSFADPPRPKRNLQTALRLTPDEAATLDRIARVMKLRAKGRPDRSAVLRHGIDALIRSLPAAVLAGPDPGDPAEDAEQAAPEAPGGPS
jgi:hypothetical protein